MTGSSWPRLPARDARRQQPLANALSPRTTAVGLDVELTVPAKSGGS